ncbi:uncharacterized protein [Rutidosis leptorrhynchoides]|uniref:uncharacterized protein n=1 Tax=Rutidosis leptorrhynchoides TaxID=125765 RepID=UPI003A98E559
MEIHHQQGDKPPRCYHKTIVKTCGHHQRGGEPPEKSETIEDDKRKRKTDIGHQLPMVTTNRVEEPPPAAITDDSVHLVQERRSMSSKNNNVWEFPEPKTKLFDGDDISMYLNLTGDEEPLNKRSKSSSSSQTTTQQSSLNNELSLYDGLNEPSPLGLCLKKSPSLLELIQEKINQSHSEKADLPSENHEATTKTDSKARAKGKRVANDKLKASHFPALLLRIGQWEYVSQHEGDLLAKCYFSKHKIVWELLDGGLKKKFEINWADIVGLKANCAAYGPGTLTIVLDKQPVFYHEINPQPKKHTQWRVTSDFTDGEASNNRQHVLQCAQGLLNQHFEKLIQCDARLNFMSRQHIVSNVPYFPPKPFFEDHDMSGNNEFNLQDIYCIERMASASTLPSSSSKTVESSSLFFIQPDMSKDVHSSSSGMSTDIEWQKDITPQLQPTMPIFDTMNYIGNCYSEQYVSSLNLPFANNVAGQVNPNDMLENISHILLSDNQLTPTSDERMLMSKVNSFFNLLQDNQNGQNIGNGSFTPDPAITMLQDIPGGFTLDSIQISKTTTQEEGSISQPTKLSQDYPNDLFAPGSSQMAQQDENVNFFLESNPSPENVTLRDGILRNDSFGDLMNQLPSIASLPRFLFDLSENGEILK